MSSTEQSTPSQMDPRVRRIAIYAGILIAVFLLGLAPMWLMARSRANERDAAQRELRLCRLEASLASAPLNARRGDYEVARQATSDFFTALRSQLDGANGETDLSPGQRDTLTPLMNNRDNLITLLSRSDPASADRLSDLYISYQKAVGRPQP